MDDYEIRNPLLEKRFVILSGPVQSQTDGDWHFVGAMELVRLYQVEVNECEFLFDSGPPGMLRNALDRGLIPLRPLYGGNYLTTKRRLLEEKNQKEESNVEVCNL